MVRNLDGKIKIVPMIVGHNSTTAPVFGTADSNVSRAVFIPQFMEATFIFSHKENGVTTTTGFTLALHESDTENGTYAAIAADEGTNSARFFESQAIPGTLVIAGSAPKASYYYTMLVNPRKPWIKAVPTNTPTALTYNVTCLLSEPRKDESAQTSEGRSMSNDNGIVI